MFYTDFSEDYEEIFPFSREVYSLLKSYLNTGPSSGQTPGKRILDIGCGTGPLCGNFAEEGHDVTGIDLDEGMIKMAKSNWPAVDFRVMNMIDIDSFEGGFDLIYSTGNVMAHIPGDEFEKLIPVISGLLNPGGVWFYQVINWDYILKQEFFRFPVIESSTKTFHRTYTEISKSGLSFNTELKNKSDGKTVFSDSVTLYPITSGEYIRMHESRGFKLIDHSANYSKAHFDPDSFSADLYGFKK